MQRKTHDEFVQEVRKLTGDEYTVIGRYVNSKTKIKLFHAKCNKEFEITPSNFINGYRCSWCAGRVYWDTNSYKREVKKITNGEYEVLGDYIKSSEKIKILHKKCNKTFDMSANNFLRGQRCPYCRWNAKKKTEEFKSEVEALEGKEYSILSEYNGRHHEITIRHNICGTKWVTTPGHFLKGVRCPFCKESKGERKIREILETNDIIFKAQYKIKKCRDKGVLSFDFAIFNKNNELEFVCEYQGAQHFKAVEFFGGDKAFKASQKRDAIKKSYCAKNDIPLLIINHWEDKQIESKIMSFMQKEKICAS